MLGIWGRKSNSSSGEASELGQVSGRTLLCLLRVLPQEQQQTWMAQIKISATNAQTPKMANFKGDWSLNQSRISLGSMLSILKFWLSCKISFNFSPWFGNKNRIGILMKDTGIWLLALAINRENLVAFCVSRMMTAEYPATWALMAFRQIGSLLGQPLQWYVFW